MYYFYNTEANQELLQAFCRRYVGSNNRFARVDTHPKLSTITNAWRRESPQAHRQYTCHYKGKVTFKKRSVLDARYVAVNFSGDKLEIRLPRGTLKHNTLMANLELAAALTEFTRTSERFAQTGKYASEFLYWIQARPRSRKDFPELVDFCIAKGFLPASMGFKSSTNYQVRKEQIAKVHALALATSKPLATPIVDHFVIAA